MGSRLKTKHFLTGEELSRSELLEVLELAEVLRLERGTQNNSLRGKSVALLFEKPSLRTRVSFNCATRELGGEVIEISSANRKHEEPEDTIRVLAGYVHAVMLRTHDHATLERMSSVSQIPLINGLSDTHHPCQALADLQTLMQSHGALKGLKLAYIGDGNNVLHSLLLLAPVLGIEVHYACPKGFEPNAFILRRAQARAREGSGKIIAHSTPLEAVKNADAIYTDVWTSMGFEGDEVQERERQRVFADYQLNAELYGHASKDAQIMHCMPCVRGLEITDEMVEHKNSALFRQSENRLHSQKALLIGLMDQ